MRIRHNLYFGQQLTRELDAIIAREGGNKSQLINDVMLEWIANRGAGKVETLLKPRLDRLSKENGQLNRELGKCRRDVGIVLEALMLFVRYVLTAFAADPEHDQAALRRGSERYDRFIAQLGRQIAAGGSNLASNDDDEEAAS
ncbi:CopG family transcriptional regulator [Novosphingobium sp. PS1R-30]|uniref:CopG family transcriptional regulator n=1 Tax=Novosphingobium anseongense TaxID=3133436 RepID=A0ABU8S1M7_9SPHN